MPMTPAEINARRERLHDSALHICRTERCICPHAVAKDHGPNCSWYIDIRACGPAQRADRKEE